MMANDQTLSDSEDSLHNVTVVQLPEDNSSTPETTLPKHVFNEDIVISQARFPSTISNPVTQPLTTSSPLTDIHRYINPLASMRFLAPSSFEQEQDLLDDISFTSDLTEECLLPTTQMKDHEILSLIAKIPILLANQKAIETLHDYILVLVNQCTF